MGTETLIKELKKTKVLESEERQTIIHCKCIGEGSELYRIWPTTFLIEHENNERKKLITAFNISFAPEWTINDGKGFTLIFEGLSKACKQFDLKEIIPFAGGFKKLNIKRNNTDVYTITLD
jgi:hypothetical protein